jgi:hypothetical protein
MKNSPPEQTLVMYRELWKKAIAQVGAGQSARETIDEMAKELGRLQREVAIAENLFRIAQSAEEAAAVHKGTNASPPVIAPGRGHKLSQAERSSVIKKVAREVALARGGEVNVRDVADAVKEKGIDLDTDVPGTMIGNVLLKSSDWNRMYKGHFRYVGSKA